MAQRFKGPKPGLRRSPHTVRPRAAKAKSLRKLASAGAGTPPKEEGSSFRAAINILKGKPRGKK